MGGPKEGKKKMGNTTRSETLGEKRKNDEQNDANDAMQQFERNAGRITYRKPTPGTTYGYALRETAALPRKEKSAPETKIQLPPPYIKWAQKNASRRGKLA